MRQALEMALEALTYIYTETTADEDELIDQSINAIKEALAQPEQEPVAFLTNRRQRLNIEFNATGLTLMPKSVDWKIPLYTTPPQRKPLTDEQILELNFDGEFCLITDDDEAILDFARLVEAAHGIKEKTV